MGCSSLSAQITPSTWGGYNSYTSLPMSAVTSSGVYFNVGDASQVMIFVINASSCTDGTLFIEPGAPNWAGSRGQARSTALGVYSTATAPITCWAALAVSTTVTTYVASTTGTCAMVGPFEAATVKSTDGMIFVMNSTVSTRMWVSVVAMGSTN
jgi:hypothetical protein